MTTLPERLRASAQVLRGLPACSEHSYEVLDVVAWNLARELEEAAQALEGADGVATDGALSPHAAALDVETVLERLDFIAGHEASAILRDTAEAAAAMIRAAHGVRGTQPTQPEN